MCNPDSYLEIDMSALSEEYLINFNHFNGVEILKIIVRDLKSNLSLKDNKIVFDYNYYVSGQLQPSDFGIFWINRFEELKRNNNLFLNMSQNEFFSIVYFCESRLFKYFIKSDKKNIDELTQVIHHKKEAAALILLVHWLSNIRKKVNTGNLKNSKWISILNDDNRDLELYIFEMVKDYFFNERLPLKLHIKYNCETGPKGKKDIVFLTQSDYIPLSKITLMASKHVFKIKDSLIVNAQDNGFWKNLVSKLKNIFAD